MADLTTQPMNANRIRNAMKGVHEVPQRAWNTSAFLNTHIHKTVHYIPILRQGIIFILISHLRVLTISLESAQQVIMNSRPIVGSSETFTNFIASAKFPIVYKHTTGKNAGFHSVQINGCEEEQGFPYSLITNYSGSYWGIYDELSGLFKILRGQSKCGIEKFLCVGTSNL
ncbi:unnamed protein product [Soboliphyme baturini]|uniref:Pept_C1 domain-containing protein n=1 Tax=Soboliphyme baturini TaxID=241478 RepID=A0A183IXJ2_9BILA|nr:unnamed protein product [Soboliphyme baturini]